LFTKLRSAENALQLRYQQAYQAQPWLNKGRDILHGVYHITLAPAISLVLPVCVPYQRCPDNVFTRQIRSFIAMLTRAGVFAFTLSPGLAGCNAWIMFKFITFSLPEC
jgi:hypothetical protein